MEAKKEPSTFEKIATYIKSNAEIVSKWTEEQRRQIYALYQQATVWDVNTADPGPYEVEARKRWEAWKAMAGTAKEKAMQTYVDLANKILPKGTFYK